MGCCLSVSNGVVGGSGKQIIDQIDGNEDDYHKRYLEGEALGEGQFGTVRMVHDVTTSNTNNNSNSIPLACKILRKGPVFKDNVLWGAIKPQTLQYEISILRTLGGNNYCVKLFSIYESSRNIYMITNYCSGGQMIEYISNLQCDLTTNDVSRISYQLLSAINHCYIHSIIHRDIKPENIMFKDPSPGSDLQLIDFGSGVLDRREESAPNNNSSNNNTKDGHFIQHTTFAGSAFYISPEMFQHNYDARTDVWSAGVALYVLVAGYPGDCLQAVFNVLHKRQRNLHIELPHLPENLPESYYDMLNKLLVYKNTKRVTAGQLLNHEFVTIYTTSNNMTSVEQDDEEEEKDNDDEQILSIAEVSAAAAAAGYGIIDDVTNKSTTKKYGNISLRGSVIRHQYFLGFKKFERSLTTLLAVMLPKNDLDRVLQEISIRTSNTNTESINNNKNKADTEEIKKQQEEQTTTTTTATTITATATTNSVDADDKEGPIGQQMLSVCKVSELKDILHNTIKNTEVLEAISKLPNVESYNNFAYHIELLVVFSSFEIAQSIPAANQSNNSNNSTSGGRRTMQLQKRGSFRRTNSFTARISSNANYMTGSNSSSKSTSSGRNGRKISIVNQQQCGGSLRGGSFFSNLSQGQDNNNSRKNYSFQGSNVFAAITLRKPKLYEDTSLRSV